VEGHPRIKGVAPRHRIFHPRTGGEVWDVRGGGGGVDPPTRAEVGGSLGRGGGAGDLFRPPGPEKGLGDLGLRGPKGGGASGGAGVGGARGPSSGLVGKKGGRGGGAPKPGPPRPPFRVGGGAWGGREKGRKKRGPRVGVWGGPAGGGGACCHTRRRFAGQGHGENEPGTVGGGPPIGTEGGEPRRPAGPPAVRGVCGGRRTTAGKNPAKNSCGRQNKGGEARETRGWGGGLAGGNPAS